MSCDDNCCGTGIGRPNVPLPGDPDNNVALSANTVYGGINLSWTFPTINPQAVAHTILYRGTDSVFEHAVELVRVGGSIFLDSLDPPAPKEYWYWLRFLTVNGTTLDPVGPVSAIAKPRGQQTLESLTGLIDNSALAQELKTPIAGVNLLGQQLLAEINNRINGNTELSGLIALVQSGQQESMTYVQQEIVNRTTADSAIVQMVNTIGAAVDQNLAVIFTQLEVLATNDMAQASSITTLFAQTSQNAAAIQQEVIVRTNQNSAMASSITTLTGRVGTAESTIRDEAILRVSGDSALGSRITATESSLNGNIATVNTNLTTKINTVDGKVIGIGAQWTAKVQVNGLIGGFGVYNDGQIVDAGFDVDRFWIGRTSSNKVKPFIVDGDTVYIDKARIRNADIDFLKIAGNSIFTGAYASSTSISSVGAGASVILLSRTMDLGDANNSGLIVTGSVYCEASNNETFGVRVLINGVNAGEQRASAREGYGVVIPVSGYALPNTRNVTVQLQAYVPGGVGPLSIGRPTMAIAGGKR